MKPAIFLLGFSATILVISPARAAAVRGLSAAEEAVQVASVRFVKDAAELAAPEEANEACGKSGILVSFPIGKSKKTYLVVRSFFTGDYAIDTETCK